MNLKKEYLTPFICLFPKFSKNITFLAMFSVDLNIPLPCSPFFHLEIIVHILSYLFFSHILSFFHLFLADSSAMCFNCVLSNFNLLFSFCIEPATCIHAIFNNNATIVTHQTCIYYFSKSRIFHSK
ncbi:hypothetical protein ICE98_00115 [Lactococcus lactis]|nr:hypothetical protein [Lactococcus lactis]